MTTQQFIKAKEREAIEHIRINGCYAPAPRGGSGGWPGASAMTEFCLRPFWSYTRNG